MPDFTTPNEILQRPPIDCGLTLSAMERILADSTATMEEMKAEYEFLWSMTNSGSPLRSTPEGLKDRGVKLRKMILYVAHLQKKVDTAKTALAELEAIASRDPLALENDAIVEGDTAGAVS